ncbi:MAG: 30S ribosomal protein S2 [Candidatus Cloacimonetes bacterium]|nr:30S ribosomal protein S2 [Candidatus Cloacimonadota bacterium]
MSVVTMKSLLESGVHFGHQTYKWNPKMDKYIFIKRNGIHILDLKQTLDAINESYMFIKDIVAKGETVLFVGTKKQAMESIENAAKKCGAFYASNRWYGGMLTNMRTIRRSIEKLDHYEQIVEDGTINSFTKLEATKMRRTYDKINFGLGGIRGMDKLPGAVFIVDIIKENIALLEAKKLGIPVVAMVDTNADPDLVDYVIPSNDDAIRAIQLISDVIANAVIEGKQALLEGADIKEAETKKQTEEEDSKETKPAKNKSKQKKEGTAEPKKEATKENAPKPKQEAEKESTSKQKQKTVTKKEKSVKKETKDKSSKPSTKTSTKKEEVTEKEPEKTAAKNKTEDVKKPAKKTTKKSTKKAEPKSEKAAEKVIKKEDK